MAQLRIGGLAEVIGRTRLVQLLGPRIQEPRPKEPKRPQKKGAA